MEFVALERRLRAELEARGAEFGLGDQITTTFRPHGGGFVNAGFTVVGGTRSLNAKCVQKPTRLDAWREHGEVLAERYRAPRPIAFFELEGWSVMLCEHIEGEEPGPDRILRDPREVLGERDPAFWERFEIGLRGIMLLCVVDVLADWNEAARAAPAVRDAHRTSAEEVHRWALDRYRTLYG